MKVQQGESFRIVVMEFFLLARCLCFVQLRAQICTCVHRDLTVDVLQGKMCQNSLLSGGGRSLAAKISGRRGRSWGIFFGFYKTWHILLSDSANCTVLRAIVLTQYRRVTDRQTDGQTDGIAVDSTVLAVMKHQNYTCCKKRARIAQTTYRC